MKIAVSGAGGHLGSEIVRQLVKRGMTVHALIFHDDRALKHIPCKIFKGSLLNQNSLNEWMNECDVIIHAAAVISVDRDPTGNVHATNVEGTRNLMEAALKNNIKRVIHISSIHVFEQEPLDRLINEESPLVDDKAIAYDQSKRDSQLLVLSYISKGIEVVVMNPTSLIGPPDHKPSLQGDAFIRIYKGGVPAVFNGGFDFVDNRDVAKAIIQSITSGKSGECYLLSGEWISMMDMIRMVNIATGKKRKAIVLPFWIGYALVPLMRLIGWIQGKPPLFTGESLGILKHGNKNISSEKAKRELQFSPRPLQETINDNMSWFDKNGYL
jgi:dihydroflavonol-4-reductase